MEPVEDTRGPFPVLDALLWWLGGVALIFSAGLLFNGTFRGHPWLLAGSILVWATAELLVWRRTRPARRRAREERAAARAAGLPGGTRPGTRARRWLAAVRPLWYTPQPTPLADLLLWAAFYISTLLIAGLITKGTFWDQGRLLAGAMAVNLAAILLIRWREHAAQRRLRAAGAAGAGGPMTIQ